MSWSRIKGHDTLVEGFRRVVRRGRLAHAYLFTGPRGVGKRLFALELARALLCEAGRDDFSACGACPGCIQVEACTHPDYFTAVRPPDVLEFPISLMRELCQNFSLKSARGHGKVVVIDDADDLNQESANCFLKTLEEPPPRSVLILIGSSPERQLSTIVSRCQVVRFGGLPPAQVDELLLAGGVEDAALRERLVRLGNGSPGAALELADPDLWAFRQRFLELLCKPPINPAEAGKLVLGFVEGAGKESAVKRGRASLMLRLVVDLLADAVAAGQGGPPRRTGPEDAALVRSLADRLSPEALLALGDRCLEADTQVERLVQLDLVVEAFLDAWAQRAGGA